MLYSAEKFNFAKKITQMDSTILSDIKATAQRVIPSNAHVILFGSQARGDFHKGSDWDLLILIDKPKIEEADHDKYAYPFWELGWKIDAMIHPVVYTLADWKNKKSLFRNNVEKDGIVVC